MQESNYHEMYDRLVEEVTALHQANQRRIHKGLWGMIIVLVLYLVLLFVTKGSKVIILLLWIMTMFALAAYLISLEYLNFELEKKLRHITQMEHDFGRNAADVVAEENLEKLRGFIAASPSLAGIIVDRIEAAQAKAAENAAHAAEAEEITAAEEPQETPFTQEEPQPDETDPAEPAGEEPTEPQPEADPEIDTPDESDASYAGSVVVVGDRAMEIPTRLDDIITSYAAEVGNLAKALGPDVRTISLVTPNGGEFYSPESLHTGEHSQKDMIDFCYGQMDSGIVTVDAYAKLRAHTDEYIYFRTDHHWTQLGAYYAYTAFCEAAGFDAVPLEQFQTGRYDTFLGSMYTFTKGYPQSDVLKQHPDYLDYYLPIADTHARYYADGSLENGTPVSVVYTQLDESVSNKYLCFIGGDTPVCIVESDVQGPTCIVLKESYGNAFVPFLTSHYGRIIVIDPREFNQEGKPTLDLAAFAADQGVDDLIVINYPYMINSKAFVRYLNALAGVK